MMVRARGFELDILSWAARLASHVEGKAWEDFDADTTLQDAVVRCVTVIGEAAGQLLKLEPDHRLKAELRRAYLTRNALTHGYEGVRYDLVWRTAIESVPELARRVEESSDERGGSDA